MTANSVVVNLETLESFIETSKQVDKYIFSDEAYKWIYIFTMRSDESHNFYKWFREVFMESYLRKPFLLRSDHKNKDLNLVNTGWMRYYHSYLSPH